MKILHVTKQPFYPYRMDGVAKSTHRLLLELKKRGIEVSTLCGQQQEISEVQTSLCNETQKALGVKSIVKKNNNIYIDCGYEVIMAKDFDAQYEKCLTHNPPSVVWSDLPGSLDILVKARRAGCGGVFYVHAPLRGAPEFRMAAHVSVELVGCSPFMVRRIKESGTEASLVYPPIEDDLEVYPDPDGFITLINAHRYKGVHLFLEIAEMMPHERFLLVESWTLDKNHLRQICCVVDKLQNVTFERRTANVKDIYQRTKLLLTPSRWEESHCMCVREAQTSGIPVIGTNRGGLPDTVGLGGIIIDVNEPVERWVETINLLLNDQERFSELKRLAKENAALSKWSVQVSADSILKACERSLQKPLFQDKRVEIPKQRLLSSVLGPVPEGQESNRYMDGDSIRRLTCRAERKLGRKLIRRPRPVWSSGLVSGPPDFVGIGAQRCGTSNLYWWLAGHPGVYHPREVPVSVEDESILFSAPKERHFWDRNSLVIDGTVTDEAVQLYQDWFPRPPGKITGEWTSCYGYYWWVPTALVKSAPNAKLLFSLRDPVERFLSGVTYVTGFTAKHAGPKQGRNLFQISHAAMERGRYYGQIKELLRHFPKEQIILIQFEKAILGDTSEERKRILRFLGLDENYTPQDPPIINASQGEKYKVGEDLHEALVAYYLEDVRAIAREYPEINIGLWKNFEGKL